MADNVHYLNALRGAIWDFTMRLTKLLLPGLVISLIVIPQPSGRHGVSLIDFDLVDTGRADPYSNAPERKIPISVFTPIALSSECRAVQKKYMPDPTARFWEQTFGTGLDLPLNNTFSQVTLSLCEPDHGDERYPLVLFSPGGGMSHQFYHIITANIASQGFTVVTIDIPGEAGLTTYLDGTTQIGTANITTEEQALEAINVRVQDIQFVLQGLPKLLGLGFHPTQSRQRQNTHGLQAAILGHSLGGATALSSMFALPKHFIGGANLDGAIFGAPLTETTNKPFMIFASDDPLVPHNQSTLPSWAAAWLNLRGPKWQLKLVNSTHGTFTDLPVLAATFGYTGVPALDGVLGSIEPHKALDVQVSTLSALAAYLFGQQSAGRVLDVATGSGAVVVENATEVDDSEVRLRYSSSNK